MQSYANLKDHQTRLLQTILSVSPDLFYILHLDRKSMFVNTATADLFEMPGGSIALE